MHSKLPDVPPQALYLSSLALIDETVRFVCRRQRCPEAEAEDFRSHVHVKLLEDDYAVLRKFSGRSSLRTYLSVVVGRLLLDYRRRSWGTWRPSAQARRAGPLAVRLDVLLYRDGLLLEEAIENLRTNEGVTASAEDLRALAARLPRRTPRRHEGEDALADLGVPAAVVERPALAQERARRAHGMRLALSRAMADIDERERLILRLRFREDLRIGNIASLLGLEVKPLYRQLGRLLSDLREALERAGFSSADFYDVVGDAAFDDPAVSGAPAAAYSRTSAAAGSAPAPIASALGEPGES
jgi:RNA polymerase sigma factor for flagellar operon FliA